MSRERFIFRNGEFVQVPNWRPPRKRIYVIGDTHEPFRSMADGKMYDSKSAYRADLKARGMVEVGGTGDMEMRPAYDERGVVEDVARAAAEHGVDVADLPTSLEAEEAAPFEYQEPGL